MPIRISDIKASIALSFERLREEPFEISAMAYDIESEFKSVSINDIQKAIKNGSLGHYGQTYKLNTQTVCIWIMRYAELNGIILRKTNQM